MNYFLKFQYANKVQSLKNKPMKDKMQFWTQQIPLPKLWSRWYSTETASDYIDDLALLAYTPAQSEFLLHNLKQAVRVIGLYMNSYKTEFMF